MTIDELIAQLQLHRASQGGSCPVLVSWEGVVREIAAGEIYAEDADSLCLDDVDGRVLLIDADPSMMPDQPHNGT